MITPDKHTKAAIKELRRLDEYTWRLSLSIKPRRCFMSGETIPMFSYAYKGFRIISGPGEDLLIVRWLSTNAYLIEKIKGTII